MASGRYLMCIKIYLCLCLEHFFPKYQAPTASSPSNIFSSLSLSLKP